MSQSAAFNKDPRDVIISPVVSEKSYARGSDKNHGTNFRPPT